MTRCSGALRKPADADAVDVRQAGDYSYKSRSWKIMGVELQGLMLMAKDHDGKPRLIQPNEHWFRNKLTDNRYLNYGTHYFLLLPSIPT